MRAIPPAAAVPVRSIGGNCQNDAPAVTGPIVPMTSQRSFLTVGREFIPKKLSAQRNPMIFDVTSERTQACTCVPFDISTAPRECAFGTGRIEALV
jgi:hypothetical protein